MNQRRPRERFPSKAGKGYRGRRLYSCDNGSAVFCHKDLLMYYLCEKFIPVRLGLTHIRLEMQEGRAPEIPVPMNFDRNYCSYMERCPSKKAL